MSRLWETYAPTGINTASSTVSPGEPNPTFQNLVQEVDSLRMKVASAEQNAESSDLEQKRLSM